MIPTRTLPTRTLPTRTLPPRTLPPRTLPPRTLPIRLVLAVLLVAEALLTSSCDRFASGPAPIPARIHFIGAVKIYQTPEGKLEPRYDVGNSLRLQLEASTPAPEQCDPFGGGSVDLALEDPDGRTALSLNLPLDEPHLTRAYPTWLLSPVPATLSDALPFRLPDRTGRWQLELTWHCPGSRKTTRSSYPFWCQLPPEQALASADVWKSLDGVDQLPAGQQIERIRAALKRKVDAESRLSLLRQLNAALLMAGEFEQAGTVARDVVQAASEARLPSEAIYGWNAAFEADRGQGRLLEAMADLDQAVALDLKLDFPRLPEEYYSRALLFNQLGQPLEALETAVEAQQQAIRLGKSILQTAAQELELELLQALGHHPIVNRRIEEVLATDTGNASIINNMGWLILRGVEAGVPLGGQASLALDRAEQAFKQAVVIFAKAGDVPDEANAVANLAEVAVLKGDVTAAQPALERARALGSPSDISLTLFCTWMHGRIQLLNHQPKEALETFRELEAQAEKQEQVEYAGRGAFEQGEALRALGDPAGATEAYDRALDWIQEDAAIHSPLHEASILSNRALWEARAVQVRLDRGEPLEALDVIERGAWGRRQSLTRAARRAQLPVEARAEVQTLREELETFDKELVRLRRLPATPENVRQRKLKEDQRQSRWATLEMKQEGTARGVPPPLSLATVRSQIPAGGRLLRFALLPDQLVVWEVDARRFEVRRTPVSRAEVEAQIDAFSASCREGRLNSSVGEALSRLLLGSAATGGDTPGDLTLVADGALRTLPWAALPVGLPAGTKQAGESKAVPAKAALSKSVAGEQASGEAAPAGAAPGEALPGRQPLVNTTILRHLPTLLWQPAPVGASSLADDGMLIVADPGRDLPEAAKEGRSLKVRFPKAVLLEREDVSRSALLAELPRVHLIHYAGHGVNDPERPYLSHLRLARDERLSLMEIQGLKLASPLVFLNACAAGMVSREGGGALGIADGFLAAGARAVIASRWDVPDQAAIKLSSLFYDRLFPSPGTVRSPAQALAETQRALLAGEGGPDATNPAVWSAFLLLGPAETDSPPAKTVESSGNLR